jgi:3-oxoacyl-[acyl-carrier protein] reductase
VVNGRVTLVTGGGRGIGRAIAIRLAKEGARVAISYHSNDAAAKETAEMVCTVGAACETFKSNAASAGDVEALLKGVSEAFGPVEILVNNAGMRQDNLLLRMKETEFDEVLVTNLKGAYLCTRAVLRGMVRARWGRIVNISSVVGLIGNAGQANYAASKAGMIGFTKSAALEFARKGITVNCVAPGYTETEMVAAVPEAAMEKVLARIPMGRLAQPEEIAQAVFFLVAYGDYITGQVIAVNGGMYM